MSVWAYVDGTIYLKEMNRGFSVRKSIQENFDEVVVSDIFHYGDKVEFVFRFCDEGVNAAKAVDVWLASNKDKIKRADVELTTRYLI